MRGQKIRAKLQALLLAACMGVCSLQVTTASAAEEKPKSVDIVFTHDTHSHLNSFRTVVDGEMWKQADLHESKQSLMRRRKKIRIRWW